MRTVLDTSVLIADSFAPQPGVEYAISAVSLAELHFGVLVSPESARPERLRRLATVERTFTALPVDAEVAAAYGAVAATVRAAGRQPRARQLDLLIAATALAHQAAVLTYNISDFAGLGDLLDVRVP